MTNCLCFPSTPAPVTITVQRNFEKRLAALQNFNDCRGFEIAPNGRWTMLATITQEAILGPRSQLHEDCAILRSLPTDANEFLDQYQLALYDVWCRWSGPTNAPGLFEAVFARVRGWFRRKGPLSLIGCLRALFAEPDVYARIKKNASSICGRI